MKRILYKSSWSDENNYVYINRSLSDENNNVRIEAGVVKRIL